MGIVLLGGGAVQLELPHGAVENRTAFIAEPLNGDPETLGLPEGVPGTGWKAGR